jgi:hypothetical protein
MSTTSRRITIDITIAIDVPDDRPAIDYMRAAHHFLMDRDASVKGTWNAGQGVTITAAQVVTERAPAGQGFMGHGHTLAPEQAQTLQGTLL